MSPLVTVLGQIGLLVLVTLLFGTTGVVAQSGTKDSNVLLWVVIGVAILAVLAGLAFWLLYEWLHKKPKMKKAKPKKAKEVKPKETPTSHKSRTSSQASIGGSTVTSTIPESKPGSTRPCDSNRTMEALSGTTDPKVGEGKSLQVRSMLPTGEMCQSTAPGLNPFQAYMVTSTIDGPSVASAFPQVPKVTSKIQDGTAKSSTINPKE